MALPCHERVCWVTWPHCQKHVGRCQRRFFLCGSLSLLRAGAHAFSFQFLAIQASLALHIGIGTGFARGLQTACIRPPCVCGRPRAVRRRSRLDCLARMTTNAVKWIVQKCAACFPLAVAGVALAFVADDSGPCPTAAVVRTLQGWQPLRQAQQPQKPPRGPFRCSAGPRTPSV